jgi:hypothetical protein
VISPFDKEKTEKKMSNEVGSPKARASQREDQSVCSRGNVPLQSLIWLFV